MNKFIINTFNKKEIKNSLLSKLKIRNYNETPVFLFMFSLIIFVNIVFFLLKLTLMHETETPLHVLFGANQSFLFVKYHHFWRLFTFWIVQDLRDFKNIFLSFLFIFLTFRTLGFYFEIFLKSKKTLFILFFGTILLSLVSTIFSYGEDMYIFGSEWICWIMLGGFLYIFWIKKENLKSKKTIISKILKISLILIFILIYRYSTLNNSSIDFQKNNNIEAKRYFYILLPIISIGIGFFLTVIAHFKELKNEIILNVSLFFVLTLIFLILIFYINYQTNILDNIFNITFKKPIFSLKTYKIITELKKWF